LAVLRNDKGNRSEDQTVGVTEREAPKVNAIGYLRVSTGRQADSGAGLASQRRAILREAERRGWAASDVQFITETASGKNARRPGLELAREALASGDAGALVVHKMDRLSRSLLDFASIMQEAQKQGWALIALDVPVDLTTPIGEAVATVIAAFAQLERKMIGERTKAALAEKRAAGVQLGRPRILPDDVRARIIGEREAGRTLRAIAETLNEDGVATAHGGARWHASTVRQVLASG
jgi:DNA invertase Pin-like site-specific DNA recombinase